MSKERVLNILEDVTTLQFSITSQWNDLEYASERDIKQIQIGLENLIGFVDDVARKEYKKK